MSSIDPLDSAIGAVLLRLRAEQGWTLYDTENLTGVSRSTLSRIERGTLSPTVASLNRICVAHRLTVSALVAQAESMLASGPR